MTISRTVQQQIDEMAPGRLFGYRDLPVFDASPSAAMRALSRLVQEEKVARFSKGKFYIPQTGRFGQRRLSDAELIKSLVYKDGKLRGYVTGTALYNRLGLTTQIPKTVTVALMNGGRQEKDFGTIRVKTITSRIPIREQDVKLLQYLDALRDIKKIPDSDINLSLKKIRDYFAQLKRRELARLVQLATEYYSPQTKALVGMLLSDMGQFSVLSGIHFSLNPTTTFKLNLDKSLWPKTRDWNIQ